MLLKWAKVRTLSEDPHSRQLQALTNAALELVDSVEQLNRESGSQIVGLTKRQATSRKIIIWLIVSLVVDLFLTVALAVGYVYLDRTAHQAEATASQLKYNSTVQRQKALCPLYQLFLDSKSPEGRKRSLDPEKYDQAFVTIEEGYKVLKCSEFATPE